MALECIGSHLFKEKKKLRFSKEKDWALGMRNGPYFFYYLSTEAPEPGTR